MPAQPDARRAVFLDRDGTLMVDTGYPRDPDEVSLIHGTVEALAQFRKAGFLLVVVSNQSGLGRGLITPDEAARVHERFVSLLSEAGFPLDAIYYCPHAPDDGCTCRKPSPELLQKAAADLGIDLDGSFMIGDKPADIEAGARAGCATILFDPSGTKTAAGCGFLASNWPQAVRFVLSDTTSIP